MPKILIALIALCCFGCYNPKKFDVTIEHTTGKNASMQITLNPKEIKVNIKHNNFGSFTKTSTYKRNIEKNEAINFYIKLNRLNLDTLKSSYTDTTGLAEESHITIARRDFSTKTIHLKNTKTPATDSLFSYIDKLIKNNNFKYNTEY